MSAEFNTDGMLDIYLYETEQLLDNLQQIALDYKDEDHFEEDQINEIFRAMHTIKGSSGVMMYDNIMHVAHKLEDIFYYIRENKDVEEPHIELVEHIFTVLDFINGELELIKEGETPDGDPEKLLAELQEFLDELKGGEKKKAPKKEPERNAELPDHFYMAPAAKSNESKFYKISISYKVTTEMCNVRAYSAVFALKEVAEDLLYFPEDILADESTSQTILAEGFHILLRSQCKKEEIEELVDTSSEVEGILIEECSAQEFARGFGGDEAPTETEVQEGQEKPVKEAPKPGDYVIKSKEPGKGKALAKQRKGKGEQVKQAFMSINIEKMDTLMTLMGEMVIAESVVLQNPQIMASGADLSEFKKAARQLTKITSQMQEVIMSMRMMPLTNTFQKMNRTVFDVSRKLGKDIEFEMIGDTTEVDKNIIEHISDPLLHLVRNAVDHGIETNEERAAAGKTEKGKVILEAKNEGGKVWVSVTDNGKGLSREKLYAKAVKNGLIDSGRSIDQFTDKEIYQFITLPGFSTKEQVTEYSGRGVGMDVVVKNIQEVGGKLKIESTEGEGSSMIIKIPLTLAIIDGILFKVADSIFIVETAAVREFIRVNSDMLIEEPDGKEYVMIRGEAYSVIRLNERYHLGEMKENDKDDIMLVLTYEGKTVGIFVDELFGSQEVVVKPIPSYIKKVPGLSGCTQLGDGSIALILDIAGLIMDQKGES